MGPSLAPIRVQGLLHKRSCVKTAKGPRICTILWTLKRSSQLPSNGNGRALTNDHNCSSLKTILKTTFNPVPSKTPPGSTESIDTLRIVSVGGVIFSRHFLSSTPQSVGTGIQELVATMPPRLPEMTQAF